MLQCSKSIVCLAPSKHISVAGHMLFGRVHPMCARDLCQPIIIAIYEKDKRVPKIKANFNNCNNITVQK